MRHLNISVIPVICLLNINLDKYINRLSEDICDLKRFIPDIDLYTYDSITKIKHYIDDNLSENDLIIINKLDEKYKTIDGFPLLQKTFDYLRKNIQNTLNLTSS